MKPTTLEKALFVAFFCATLLVAPEQDYDPYMFFWILALLQYAPLLVVLEIVAIAVWLTVRGIARIRDSRPRTAFFLFVVPGIVVVGLLASALLPEAQWSWTYIVHDEAVVLDIVAIAVPICFVLLGVPLWAAGRGLLALVKREWRTALWYLAVPPIGIGCYFLGQTGADLLAVQSIGPAIQMQIRDARGGKVLPITSRSYPFRVSEKPPDMAAYVLGGPLFYGSYVVYDPSDNTLADEATRVGIFLDGGSCSVNVRPIGWHYYHSTELC